MRVVVAQSLEPVTDKVDELVDQFLASLPLLALGVAVAVVGLVVARLLVRGAQSGLQRSGAGPIAVNLLSRLTAYALYFLALLFALSVAGVPVGSVLGALAVFGIAIGLAAQEVIGNFIAGLILLWRQPFVAGDQIISGDHEGTVETIDLRVTHLIDYDGELVLIPNHDVFTSPLTNLTRRGSRRSRVVVGVDYDDDHNEAREVLREAVRAVDGVYDDPPPQVLLCELGDSSVNFEIRYWTDPDIATVRAVQDRVLSDAKTALDDAGLTIPWPVRTLVIDTPVTVERNGDGP
jgi:small-conductance mechanosensitive channel